jgi:hypothetical protein
MTTDQNKADMERFLSTCWAEAAIDLPTGPNWPSSCRQESYRLFRSCQILKLQFILNIHQICNYSLENITFKKQGMRPDSLYRRCGKARACRTTQAAASWLSVTQHITHDQGSKENSSGLDPK